MPRSHPAVTIRCPAGAGLHWLLLPTNTNGSALYLCESPFPWCLDCAIADVEIDSAPTTKMDAAVKFFIASSMHCDLLCTPALRPACTGVTIADQACCRPEGTSARSRSTGAACGQAGSE